MEMKDDNNDKSPSSKGEKASSEERQNDKKVIIKKNTKNPDDQIEDMLVDQLEKVHIESHDDSGSENDDEERDDSSTLKEIANLIKEGKLCKILVLSGAGVSCAAGIPDFRSPLTGLYDNLQKYNLPYPEAIFDLDFYRDDPMPFVTLASELWPGLKHSPTLTHSFVALLDQKGLLLRNYTQNIDGLEALAGVSPDRLVECHGHFRTASCIDCHKLHLKCKETIVNEVRPMYCSKPNCKGLVKPDIVFFGEGLPKRFEDLLYEDIKHADLLIVMGTSLTVRPVSLIPEFVKEDCRRLLINREMVGDFTPSADNKGFIRDFFEPGDCDESTTQLCRFLGWENELYELNATTKIKFNDST